MSGMCVFILTRLTLAIGLPQNGRFLVYPSRMIPATGCAIFSYCKFKFGVQDSETLRTTLPWPIAVVKWYRIYADWYKPDPAYLGEW